MRAWLAILLLTFFVLPVLASEATPLVPDEATEQHLIAISKELRCLVCQNESLADSNAELAYDLRREIRGLIKAGKNDPEIMDFMVSRYSDFVRYRPPLKGTTLLLWFGPALLLLVALLGLLLLLRRRNRTVIDVPLSAEERQQAEHLINDKEPQT